MINIVSSRLLVPLISALIFVPTLGCALATRWGDQKQDQGPRSITYSGLERTYRLHIPTAYEETRPTPLVIALHGGGGTGERMDKFTGGLNPLAEREGFIVAYPDGVDKQWNDGREIFGAANTDDVGFLSALIDHIAEHYTIDPGRVYATGISNGGLMSFRLACDLSEKVTAVAPVTAALSEDLVPNCSPSHPVSVLLINGTEDPLVPWEGGQIKVWRQERGAVISTADTVQFWVTQNHCPGPPNVSWEPDTDLKDGTRVRREAYDGCRDGTKVVLYAVEGGGHTWPGGKQYLPKGLIGRTSRDIDANELIWHFFEENPARRTASE